MLRRTFTLGRYHCVERCASGPLGETWRAKLYGPAGVEGQVALERIHAHLVQDAAFLERLGAAVERYRALEHEGIPRLREVGQKGPQRYLVFDPPTGVALPRLRAALLQVSGEVSPARLPEVVSLVGQALCEILEYAHGKGVLAQGLSPQTGLVDAAGQVQIVHLGLLHARLHGDWHAAPEVAPLAPYLAPEVEHGEPPTPRADVYSVAAVLLELLTGAPVPEAARRPSGRIIGSGAPQARQAPALWQALQRALQPRPGDRPAGPAELAAALPPPSDEARDLLAQLAPHLAAAEPAPPPPEERVLIASSAESARRSVDLVSGEPAPLPALKAAPISAPLAIAPRQLAGAVLAVEEEEHTVPVPHSPKSRIKIIEAEPPGGSRIGLGASLREPEPTPVSRLSQVSNPGAEITAVPGLPGVREPAAPSSVSADLLGVPEAAEGDVGSGPTALTPAAPPVVRVMVPGVRKAAPEPDEPEGDLDEFEEPTTLADYAGSDDLSALLDLSAQDPGAAPASPPSSGTLEVDPLDVLPAPTPPPPPRRAPALADQFAPLITDPVPRVTPEEIDAGLPPAGTQLSPVPELPQAPPSPVVVALPSLSKDDDAWGGLDDILGSDEPTGSIPHSPARRLAAMAESGALPAEGMPVEAPPEPPPIDAAPAPAWTAPVAPAQPLPEPSAPEVQTAPRPVGTVPPPGPPGPPAPGGAVTGPAAPASPPLLTGTPPAAQRRIISPAVALSFFLALLVGGSVPLLIRALRRPPPRSSVMTGARPTPPSAPAPAAAPAPPPAPAAPAAGAPDSLTLSSTPPAAVFVDGKPAGRTPLTLRLGEGRHRLLLMADRHKLWRKEVSAGPPLTVELTPTALPPGVAGPSGLKVRCATKGQLRILVDGHDSGVNCPTERMGLSPGPHKIEFFRPRTGDTVARQVNMKKGKNSSTRLYTKF